MRGRPGSQSQVKSLTHFFFYSKIKMVWGFKLGRALFYSVPPFHHESLEFCLVLVYGALDKRGLLWLHRYLQSTKEQPFDCVSDHTWPILAPTFLHNSAGTSLVNVGGKQVAISTYGTLENDCVYDVSVNSWTSLPAGRIERDRPGVGHHQGKLIIAGGWLDGYPVAGPRRSGYFGRRSGNKLPPWGG